MSSSKTLTLKECASLTGATLHGDPTHQITGISALESATPTDITFLAKGHYVKHSHYGKLLPASEAGLICIDPNTPLIEGKNFLVSEDPSRTFQQIAEELLKDLPLTGFTGIHPTAIIHEEATLGPNVTVAPYAVIDNHAEIGEGSIIGPHAYVGAGTLLGKNCTLHPHSVIREHCQLGDRVILQPGAVVGSCGFGYTTDEKGEHQKLEQLGNVILEEDVEIGANATIDRARFKTTRVGRGTKIDNLVQIAHNVELGEHNILAAQTGIAGSAKTGRNVIMGGQVGIVGHLEITDFVMIATRGGVSKSLTRSGKYAGAPVVSLAEHNRTQVYLRKIETFTKKVSELEKRLKELETQTTAPCN